MPLSPQERKANYDAFANFKLPGPEMRMMGVAAGMVTSAVTQVEKEATDFSKDWVLDSDGMFIHTETGESMQEVVERWRTERPHLWPQKPDPTILDEAALAFGDAPTLKARGDFLREHGQDQFNKYLEIFGADVRTLKPGRLPEASDGEDVAPKAKPSTANNPFSDEWPGGPMSPSALAKRASILKSLGSKVAAQMAASVGRSVTGAPLKR